MADLGTVGTVDPAGTFQYVNPGSLIGTSGVSELFTTRQFRPLGGLASLDVSTVKLGLANGVALRAEGRSVSGETQLNGVASPLMAMVTSNGAVIGRYLSTPALIIRDLPDYMPYEITVFGGDAKRTETWGVSSVDAHVDLALTGALAACTASVAYSSGLTRVGGFGVVTWDLWPSLPSGLGFNTSTGVISGTTAATGSYSIDIGVTLEGVRVWKNVTLTVT